MCKYMYGYMQGFLAEWQVVIHGTTPTSESRSRLDEICTWLEAGDGHEQQFD